MEKITKDELFRDWENDFDKYPLPICFDPQEELSELNKRSMRIKRDVEEYLKFEPSTSLPETLKTLDNFWDEVVYTQHLESGDEAYIVEKDDFLKAMQEYADLQKKQLTEEHLKTVEMLVKSVKLAHSEAIENAIKTAESISFNTEDQAGNKFIAVDLNELKEKLKIS